MIKDDAEYRKVVHELESLTDKGSNYHMLVDYYKNVLIKIDAKIDELSKELKEYDDKYYPII